MQLLSEPKTPVITEDIFFPAGQYRLHGELAYPEVGSARAAVIFAGPHPLLGGNLRNNVVRLLGDGLAQRSLLTLRFDYRGVGRSEGPSVDISKHLAEFWKTSHAPGEMDFWLDVQAAAEFIQRIAPGLPLALIGYSFGSALLPNIRLREELAALVLIAPTVAKHNYEPFRSITTPLLVVASDDDFATDAQELEEWFGTLAMPRQIVRKHCDNHFFRGHEDWLLETINQFLDSRWSG